MIGRLLGRLVSEELDGTAILDVGGVGYEVLLPLGTGARAQQENQQVLLHVHTHVKEDALSLYGFATSLERQIFRLLISVPNVGPKTALAILSQLPPEELVQAVVQGDLKRLGKIPGIGKKTAERLVLELKEKLTRLGSFSAGAPTPPSAAPSTDKDRLLGALVNMGYRPAEAERAVASLGENLGQASLQEALKAALAFLAR